MSRSLLPTRPALEAAVDGYWQSRLLAVAACWGRRTKMRLLRRFIAPQVTKKAVYAWAALSRMTHHQCYDSPPSPVELRRLHQTVQALADTLHDARLEFGWTMTILAG